MESRWFDCIFSAYIDICMVKCGKSGYFCMCMCMRSYKEKVIHEKIVKNYLYEKAVVKLKKVFVYKIRFRGVRVYDFHIYFYMAVEIC